MRRQLGVELARWRSRGVVVALMVAALLFAVVAAGLVAWQSRPLTAADQRDADAQSALAARDPEVRAELADCQDDPAAYFGEGATAAECRTLVPGSERFLPREGLDLAQVVPQRGADVALVVVCLMVVAGCTFAGSDWATRSMATQLGVQPRRTRLWLVKALAVVIGSAVAAAVALLAFWAVLAVVVEVRGLDADGAAVTGALQQVGRATALAAAAALGGFALTMALRHTVATLALLFVYAVGGEIALSLSPVDGAEQWSVGCNALAWVDPSRSTLDPLLAGAFLGALTLLAALLSLVVFARRDV